jgi:integrase
MIPNKPIPAGNEYRPRLRYFLDLPPMSLSCDYLDDAGHAADTEGALFRPISNNRTGELDCTITPDGVYKLLRCYALALGLKIGAHALRATAATNALDHDADIAKVQEWLGFANIATTRIYDRRNMKPEDSPTFIKDGPWAHQQSLPHLKFKAGAQSN